MERLFYPRVDRWDEHFRFDGAKVTGLTTVGRVTADVLKMNAGIRVALRAELIGAGFSLAIGNEGEPPAG